MVGCVAADRRRRVQLLVVGGEGVVYARNEESNVNAACGDRRAHGELEIENIDIYAYLSQ